MSGKIIIGLTGGIGSGKSMACRLFNEKGIDIVDADLVAREVVEPGMPALTAIAEHFGDAILQTFSSGPQQLNRAKLRELIFANPQEKQWLEALLHPLINQRIREQLKNARGPYAILASPLLLETQQFQLVDRVLVIDASEELQIERASQRDTSNPDQIKAIMATQLPRKERCARADDIIENHGSVADLQMQVERLHQHYLGLAQST